MNTTIDINCDLGEGLNNESELMPYISSCSIACGGHAGSKRTIRQVIDLAVANGVKVGAHPSFPDRANFGRIRLDIPFMELKRSIEEQLALILQICEEKEVPMNHVKPHGALYNLAANDRSYAELLVSIVKMSAPKSKLYVPYHSVIHQVAMKEGIDCVVEAFADRNYNSDYSLVSRNKENALISHPEELLKHLLRMFEEQQIRCHDDTILPIEADTFCVHGDNPKAAEILQFISDQLTEKSIKVAKQN